jgi:hypothetical protein
MAKDLSTKIMVCPSAWWWHLFKCRGDTKRTAKSLMDSFDYEASLIADQSTFDKSTWTVTTQFANSDDFLDRVEAELGLDNDDDQSLDGSLDGTPHPKTSFKISANAKASLASTLDNPDMDLAANSHASAKSRRTNFSLSTGNSTNRSINTRKFAIAHKSRALKLAMEKKCAAQLEFKNKDMARQLQELELLFANNNTGSIPPEGPPAPPGRHSICIAATGPSHSSIDNSTHPLPATPMFRSSSHSLKRKNHPNPPIVSHPRNISMYPRVVCKGDIPWMGIINGPLFPSQCRWDWGER